MKTIEQILELKKQLCIERDKYADLYTLYIQELVANENNPEIYDSYVKKIESLEGPTKETKEKMREYNRELEKLGFK